MSSNTWFSWINVILVSVLHLRVSWSFCLQININCANTARISEKYRLFLLFTSSGVAGELLSSYAGFSASSSNKSSSISCPPWPQITKGIFQAGFSGGPNRFWTLWYAVNTLSMIYRGTKSYASASKQAHNSAFPRVPTAFLSLWILTIWGTTCSTIQQSPNFLSFFISFFLSFFSAYLIGPSIQRAAVVLAPGHGMSGSI